MLRLHRGSMTFIIAPRASFSQIPQHHDATCKQTSATSPRPLSSPARQSQSLPIEVSETEAQQIVQTASSHLQPQFAKVDRLTKQHLANVLTAMKKHRVSSQTFLSVDGYGHADYGREVLDEVYASIFQCESALVRIQFLSGTHAIASVLYGVLRPGDDLLCVAGPVYDTLEEVLGTRTTTENPGSLSDFGIKTHTLPLLPNGHVDLERLPEAITPQTKMIFIQRSFGYDWRPVLTINDIRDIIDVARSKRPDIICFVDNCYGEFTESIEPVHPSVGADVMAGSLIKNLGGGIVPSGAYIAGREHIIRKAKARLSAPGIGGGATLGYLRNMFQGVFMAPGAVGEAMKASYLIAHVMSKLGYEVLPLEDEAGFVRAVKMGSHEKVIEFCKAVQRNGPVGAFIQPTVGATDGYGDDVIFAQGTFIDGSTIELSADGPMRPPYAVFAQGALHWTHWAIVLEDIATAVGRQHVDFV